jgi:hypothetical protein
MKARNATYVHDLLGRAAGSVKPDLYPAELGSDGSRENPAAPIAAAPCGAGIEFGQTLTAASQELLRPRQDPTRVTAQPHVVVGQDHRVPAADAGQRRGHIPMACRRPAASSELNDGL